MRRALTRIFLTSLIAGLLASTAFAQPPQGRWAPFGPGGGTPTGLAVDPRDSSVVYAATGNLYRSADGGETWTPLFGPGFGVVAVDPANPAVVYAGGSQLARSTDGGRSWKITRSGSLQVTSLAVLPGSPSTVLAASGYQLFRSANGGRTWSARLTNSFITAVAADLDSPRTAYYTDDLGLHKSTDAGKSWSASGPPADGHLVPHSLLAATPGALYLDAGGRAIYQSVDGARSWRQTGSPPAEASLDRAFLADPSSPATLYLAGLGGIYRSEDEGATWTMLAGGLPRLPLGTTLAVYSLAADPARPGFLYAGSYQRGVARSTDGGESWDIGVQTGLDDGPVALFKLHPSRPDTSYVGLATRGDRAFRGTDGGHTWEPFASQIAGDGLLDLGFDPADPETLYAANEQGLWKSGDGGETWKRLDTSSFSKVAVLTPGTLLAGRGCGLSRSADDGRTWTLVIPCFTGDDLTTFTSGLWVDPEDPRSSYAMMRATNGASGNDSFLARSTDGGATWTIVRHKLLSATVAPGDFRTLYAVDGTGFSLLRSTDAGESWRTVHAPLRYPYVFGALAVSAADPETLYVAGNPQQGLLRSRNGGVTLTPLGVPFDAAKRAPASLFTDRGHPGVVWAATANGGLFWGRFE
jgi:photosystem II stability/assembly factor-like uncharacterized protein